MSNHTRQKKAGAGSTARPNPAILDRATALSHSPSGRRRFTDEYRVNAIFAVETNGGNVKRTAKELGIPRDTLRCWIKGRRVPSVVQEHHYRKESVLQSCENAVWLLLGGLADPAAILRAPLGQRATAFACVFDKWMILKGLPGPAPSVPVDEPLTAGMAKMTPEQLEQLSSILETLMSPETPTDTDAPRIS